jgi:hypothetical protein
MGKDEMRQLDDIMQDSNLVEQFLKVGVCELVLFSTLLQQLYNDNNACASKLAHHALFLLSTKSCPPWLRSCMIERMSGSNHARRSWVPARTSSTRW